MKLPKDQYLALQKFKKKANAEKVGKIVRDHSGHLYRVDNNGSLQKLTREEMLEYVNKNESSNSNDVGDALRKIRT